MGNALLLTVQQEQGSWASSLGCSAAAGHPEGQGWMPEGFAPPFYRSGCKCQWGVRSRVLWKGRSSVLVLGAHQEELLVGDHWSCELSITGGWWRWLSSPRFHEREGRNNTVCSSGFMGEKFSCHLCHPEVRWKGFQCPPTLSRSALYSILQSWWDIAAKCFSCICAYDFYMYNGCNLSAYVCADELQPSTY